MYNPISTYRIQFNNEFPLKQFKDHIDYLKLLGIGTIYASPMLTATPGSGHGYDVTDPLSFNPEITTKEEFHAACKILRSKDIGWLQDIVPNHMAYHQENRWMMDLLEKGEHSEYHKFFDLEPGVPSPANRLMVPFLGATPQEALQNKELKIGFHDGNFSVEYFDNVYPVNFETFQGLIKMGIEQAPQSLLKLWHDFFSSDPIISTAFLNHDWEEIKLALQYLNDNDDNISKYISKVVEMVNEDEEKIREILDNQHYELCYWQETEKRINYRRFFTVNSLICLSMENTEVFDQYHRLIASQLKEGCFDGIRIDHIDGLNNPTDYLRKLRKLCGNTIYIVAEKILEAGEDLPDFWPLQGSTGYDFLATVNNLLTSTRDYDKLHDLYKNITHQPLPAEELIYQNKRMMLTTRMHGEWDNIVDYFNRLEFFQYTEDGVSREEIKEALGEIMLACPVYRLYPRSFPLDKKNHGLVEEIITHAAQRNPGLKNAMDIISGILLNSDQKNQEMNDKAGSFFSRMMQYTGPLMAKGVEDTSMYQYNLFITHNEVGDAINASGITIDEFHEQMKQRQQKWPLTMNTTSTHDTKRGEDVRARLNVISELTGEWEEHVLQWIQMNQKFKIRLDTGLLEPSLSVEYFIYQTLMGTFPVDGQCDETYLQRIDEYLVKALRESKRKVSWRNPDETYESAVCRFARSILDPSHEFLASFVPFQQKIAWYGSINSLTQLTLKCTCPGIPDIYQGTELWDLSLVDPDNRQPVDYDLRMETLQLLREDYKSNPEPFIRNLMLDFKSGNIKLWYTQLLLNLRRNHPHLFLTGEYIPIKTAGEHKGKAMAFARRHNNQWLIVVVPLFVSSLLDISSRKPDTSFDWKDTHLVLAEDAPKQWLNTFNDHNISSQGNIYLNDLMGDVTPCVLVAAL